MDFLTLQTTILRYKPLRYKTLYVCFCMTYVILLIPTIKQTFIIPAILWNEKKDSRGN